MFSSLPCARSTRIMSFDVSAVVQPESAKAPATANREARAKPRRWERPAWPVWSEKSAVLAVDVKIDFLD